MVGIRRIRSLAGLVGIIWALFAWAAGPAGAAPPAAMPRAALAVQIDEAPKIDGVLDDAAWANSVGARGFTTDAAGTPARPDTVFCVAYDTRTLYIGIRAEEPAMDQLAGQERRFDDAAILGDDNVQVLLQSSPGQSTFYHFIVNAWGARRDAAATDPNVDFTWTAAASRGDGAWSAELAIPLASIGMDIPGIGVRWLQEGDHMRLNVARHRAAGAGPEKTEQLSSWSFLTTGFTEKDDFGYLAFSDYNKVLRKRRDAVRQQLRALQQLLPADSKPDLAAVSDKLTLRGNAATETAFRTAMGNLKDAEASLNELLDKRMPAPQGGEPDLILSHLAPWESIAKDRLAQLVYYAEASSRREAVALKYEQAVNEYEHDAFALSSGSGISGLKISAGDLTGPGGQTIPASQVKCHVVGYVDPQPDDDFNYATWNKIPAADLVEEIRHPVSLAALESKQIWVTVYSRDAAPGRYEGAVTISDSNGRTLHTVPIQVTVWPIVLPKKPALDIFYFQGVPFAGRSGELYADFLVDHYASWVHMELPADVRVGERDVPHQGREVKDLDPGFEIGNQPVSIPGLKWNNLERLKLLRARNLKLNFDTGEGLMPPALIPDFVKYLKSAGFGYEDFRYKISDEDQSPWSLPIFKAYKQVDPQMRLLMIPAGSWDITPYAPYTDFYMCSYSVTAWKEWLPWFQQENREHGKPFSIYTNWPSWSGRTTLSEMRADLRFIWRIGATEYSVWNAQIYPPTGYTYPYSGAPMRDLRNIPPERQSTSTLIYIRSEDGVIYPIASKRLEVVRDGIKDWMYLNLLRETLIKCQGIAPAGLLQRGEALLANQGVENREIDYAQYALSKAELAQQIMELQDALNKAGKPAE